MYRDKENGGGVEMYILTQFWKMGWMEVDTGLREQQKLQSNVEVSTETAQLP